MNNFNQKDTQENKINQDSTLEKTEPLDVEDNQKNDANIVENDSKDSAFINNDLEKINNEFGDVFLMADLIQHIQNSFICAAMSRAP